MLSQSGVEFFLFPSGAVLSGYNLLVDTSAISSVWRELPCCVYHLKMGMHDLNKQSYMFISLCFVLYSKGHNFPSSVLHLDAC